jgi:hypothetical protein
MNFRTWLNYYVIRDDTGASIYVVGQFCVVVIIIAEELCTFKFQLKLPAVVKWNTPVTIQGIRMIFTFGGGQKSVSDNDRTGAL